MTIRATKPIENAGSAVADRRRALAGRLLVFSLADLAVLREAMLREMFLAKNVRLPCDDLRRADHAFERRAALRARRERRIGQLLQALDAAAAYPATLRACADAAMALKPQLRVLLQYHCGSPVLRTRQLMMDLQSL